MKESYAALCQIRESLFREIFQNHSRNKTNSVDRESLLPRKMSIFQLTNTLFFGYNLSIRSIHFERVFLQGGGLVLFDKVNFETNHIWCSAKKTQWL